MHYGLQDALMCVYSNCYDLSRFYFDWNVLEIKTELSRSGLFSQDGDETVTIAIEILLFPQSQVCQEIKIRTSLNPKDMNKT